MPRVFISHSSSDRDFVEGVIMPALTRHGLETWYSKDDIRSASEWERNIREALKGCDWFLVVMSPRAVKSEWVRCEVFWAAERRWQRIVPIMYEECDPADLHLKLAQLQFVDFRGDIEAACARLLRVWGIAYEPVKPQRSSREISVETLSAMKEIAKHLQSTQTAFLAQGRRRNLLVKMIGSRFKIPPGQTFESLFLRCYGKLNSEEKFQFDQIRAITEGPLYGDNKRILGIIEEHPELIEHVPRLADLRDHLALWVNKYDKVFAKRPDMCLLYVGVEDGVPFPPGVGEEIRNWLGSHGKPSS